MKSQFGLFWNDFLRKLRGSFAIFNFLLKSRTNKEEEEKFSKTIPDMPSPFITTPNIILEILAKKLRQQISAKRFI